ncbi:MAG: M20 family metallopeptidase [Clostridia bacterium]|nr:M20 family metallopeptidase [Clostridia bacterium]
MISEKIKNVSHTLKEEFISIRRHLHAFPELGYKEFKTSAFIANYLKDLGLEVKTHIAGTGVTGLLKSNSSGQTIAIRADMDALPIHEQNEIDYVSKNEGIMHACGHDAHVSIVLGTAKILSKLKNELKTNVKFVFQPGEEGLGGAKKMIDGGVLKDPDVGFMIAAHVCPDIEAGHISIGTGPVMASPGEFEIRIKGKGGHAAKPHTAIDPIQIGASLIPMFQSIVSREKSPFQPAVLSVTYFHAGSSYNIIPDQAVLKGTVRTFDRKLSQWICDKMKSLTSSATKAMGADFEFMYDFGYPPVLNHPDIVKKIVSSAGKIIPEKSIITGISPSMLAEDFSYYAEKIPSAIFNLGCKSNREGVINSLHNSRFNIDEDCIQVGMEIMSQFALDC